MCSPTVGRAFLLLFYRIFRILSTAAAQQKGLPAGAGARGSRSFRLLYKVKLE
jgi:hypothetical protein